MRVIVYAQDLSGRRDDGYYSKPDLDSVLDIFFNSADDENFADENATHIFGRDDAQAIFEQDGKVLFYNADGERIVITKDPSA